MRVIAGTARRAVLTAPVGMDTRPTADRAKEALFSILGARVQGARFLDLFCGSGAVGIEALSRGAKEAVFVERAKPALDALKKNLAATKLAPHADIMAMPAARAVLQLHQLGRRFDIIFMDPPYEGAHIKEMLDALSQYPILENSGVIIAETDAPAPEAVPFVPEQERRYGRTRFLFYRTGAS